MATHRGGPSRARGAFARDPDIIYLPCSRPLIHEADRIARAIHEQHIGYLLLDSAAPACNGRPEDSENASA